MIPDCTLGELMIAALARTVEDGTVAFHGFGSPLVQLALHVAKRTHAPNMVLIAGATYAVDPDPPFLSPTSNDWVMDRGAVATLDIEELFDLAAAGRLGRMFLSGLQIDKWGNCNVTRVGTKRLEMKLPGGGGGCNLSCDAEHLTLWTTGHRATPDAAGARRHRLVERCDFITNLGHRGTDGRGRNALGHRGRGPQWLVTDLGLFDFDSEGHARLRAVHPDVTVDEVQSNTGFKLRLAPAVETVALPNAETVALIRRLDPLEVHARELRPADRERRFTLASSAPPAQCPATKATPPPWPSLRDCRNFVELPYRGVSVQPYEGAMTEVAITAHLMGRELYRRTNAIVLHDPKGAHALVAVGARNREPLFAPIEHVEVLALPDTCRFVVDPDTDCANRTALARLAERCGVGPDATLICQGKYDHVNFIHHPDPLVLRVVEVSPPDPPKLYSLIEHVLTYADLPPIRLELEKIELRDLARCARADSYLVPCRSGGLDDLGAPVHFLDERPAQRENWVMIGCERSLQFHRHYYGDEPPRIEMCPRAIAGARNRLTILKCCLLEFGIERQDNVMVVPWGSDLAMIEEALQELASRAH